MASFTDLRRLDLSLNFFGPGNIPKEWAALTALDTLTLEVNVLTGQLPSEMAGLSSLRDFEVADNQLNGTIPTELGLLTLLEDIELTNNTFAGPIPTELGNLSRLQDLELDINQLTGTIPTALGRLVNLSKFGKFGSEELSDLSLLIITHTNPHAAQLFLQTNTVNGSAPAEVCALTTGSLQRFITDCAGATPEVVCTCCSECR